MLPKENVGGMAYSKSWNHTKIYFILYKILAIAESILQQKVHIFRANNLTQLPKVIATIVNNSGY